MIEFLEIRDRTFKMLGVVDTAKSIIWRADYYGAGEIEIFAGLDENNLALLQRGNFITRRGEINAAIIEAVDYTDTQRDGVMIKATGRMLKSILDRRLAYRLTGHTATPVRMSGSLANAIHNVVQEQAGATAAPARKMGVVRGSNGGITKTIKSKSDEESSRQSSYQNLLKFTDSVLQEYECGALMRISGSEMIYDLYEGKDRSVGNEAGNLPIIFSQNFDNLLSAEYEVDDAKLKTFALIGGEGEGLDRFYSTLNGTNGTGLDRREVFVDAQSLPRKYEEDGQEKQYTDAEYTIMLQGKAQTDLAEMITTETFTGEINLTYSPWKYRDDFGLGDLVTIQDNRLGLYITTRILSVTEVQDINGFKVVLDYGS